jgi:hypothetical protein
MGGGEVHAAADLAGIDVTIHVDGEEAAVIKAILADRRGGWKRPNRSLPNAV